MLRIRDIVVGLCEFENFVDNITSFDFEEIFSMFIFFTFFLSFFNLIFGLIRTHSLGVLEVFLEFFNFFLH